MAHTDTALRDLAVKLLPGAVHLHVHFGDDLVHGVEAPMLCGEVEFRVAVLTGCLLDVLILGSMAQL